VIRALALIALLPSVARAAVPTVAVMPFKDLSGSSTAIGEAIRETVTSDLKELSGVRVIERGNLDKILAEQHLQAQRTDLDPSTAAKVGKLLGATIICGGAYQKAAPKIRLTARFVNVETGEIIGTAKVDGDQSQLLKLQDKITSVLLAKAGLGGHSKKFEERARPPVKPTTIEFYGQSLLADNDDLKKKYLQLALAEDKDFSYAAKDLASLEKRMVVYQANADIVRDKAAREAHAQLEKETDAARYYGLLNQVFAGLLQSRRYRSMIGEARYILAHPPKLTGNVYPGMPKIEEVASFYLVNAEQSLGDDDALLRDGEKFLRDHPGSMYFGAIKGYMDTAINEKKKVEEGKAQLVKDLAELQPMFKNDPCKLAFVYSGASQYREAKQFFRKCIDGGGNRFFAISVVVPGAIEADIRTHDFEQAKRDIALYEKVDPATFRSVKYAYELRIPQD
jgi:TolB-like protein